MSEKFTFPFIVGRGRSGTTLLVAMLNSNPEMAIPYESHFVVSMAQDLHRYETTEGFDTDLFQRDLFGHWAFRRWNLAKEEVAEALLAAPPSSYADAIRLVYSTYARRHGATRYGEKTPGFVTHIPILARNFPESRFIHVIRDGRNVALSYLEGGWGPRNLEEAALYWKRFVERGRRDGKELGPERYMEMHYEELLEDPDDKLRAICNHIDLGFDDSMLRYFERTDVVPARLRPHLARGHQNLRLPPTKGLRDWREQMSKREVGLFEAIAGDLLEELGYERRHTSFSPSVRLAAQRRLLGVHTRRAMRRAQKIKSRKGAH